MNANASSRSARPTTTRMFESDLIEYFSRIHPATPFVVWLPVLGYVAYRVYGRHDLALGPALGLGVAGFFIWTLTEYVLHRYVFHWTNDTKFGKRVHFLLHGVHHDFPQDKDRLVMPIGASAPISVIVYGLLYLLCAGPTYAEPLFVGFGLGYLLYDGTHFALHHFNFKGHLFRKLKRHHMLHHHADHDGGFGVSSPLWDVVFRTMPAVKPAGGKSSNA
jgi:sterol desaturase/sphingolipid hydroxylase (fatty acid hydroxylase superfamily)